MVNILIKEPSDKSYINPLRKSAASCVSFCTGTNVLCIGCFVLNFYSLLQISRMLAAKTALAARYDALGEGETSTEMAILNRAKLEDRIRALDEGKVSFLSN